MSKHTEGNLHVNGVTDGIYCGDLFIATTVGENEADNARRLVACWNALVGVDTDFIERVPQSPGFDIVQLLTKERDELLEALKTIVDLDDGDTPDLWHFEKEFDEGREVIAKYAKEPK